MSRCPLCNQNTVKTQRSIPQNSYYFGVIVKTIADEIGETPMTVHEILKSEFLKELIYKEINGEMKEFAVVKSTTDLSPKEFEEYQSAVRMWASEFLNVYIALPNEDNL